VLNALGLSLCLLFHPLSFLIAMIVGAVVVGTHATDLGIKGWILILFSLAFALLTNLIWIAPIVRHLFCLAAPALAPPHFGELLKDYLGIGGSSIDMGRAIVRLVLLGAFGWGLFNISKHDVRKAALFLAWFLLAAVGCLFHSHLPLLKYTSPGQWAVTLTPIVIFPAARSLASFLVRPGTLRLIAFLFVAWFQLTAPVSLGAPSIALNSDESPVGNLLLKDVGQLHGTGRILIETTPSNGQVLDLLPIAVHREFLGTQGEDAFLIQSAHTNFTAKTDHTKSVLFDRPFASYDRDTLVAALKRLNVQFVIASSLQARSRFDRYSQDFRPLPFKHEPDAPDDASKNADARLKKLTFYSHVVPYRVYEVSAYQPNAFIEGSGTVKSAPDQIVIENASPGRIVLKYHWLPSLRATPGVQLRPVRTNGDPVPLILLENSAPRSHIYIWNAP
jgi:hypothetical protein